ncbi:MAG: hypothetical protein NZ523_01855 [Elioraea sp.]|nr:hypothetical protein [Elioraea sp.]
MQPFAKVHTGGVAHGIAAPGFSATRDAIQVALVQTLGPGLAAAATSI